MLVKGTYEGNVLNTQDGVFEVPANTSKAFTGVFEINNIRCEETEKLVQVEGRTVKVFIPKLKADVLAQYKQLEDSSKNITPIANELELDNEDKSEDLVQQSYTEEQPKPLQSSDEDSEALDREIEYFDMPLSELKSFKVDSSLPREVIKEQFAMLFKAGFRFQASTQTYIKD